MFEEKCEVKETSEVGNVTKHAYHNLTYKSGNGEEDLVSGVVKYDNKGVKLGAIGKTEPHIQSMPSSVENHKSDNHDTPISVEKSDIQSTLSLAEKTNSDVLSMQGSVEKTESGVHSTQRSAEKTESDSHTTQLSVEITEADVHIMQSSVVKSESDIHCTKSSAEKTESDIHCTQNSSEKTESHIYCKQISVEKTESDNHSAQRSVEKTEPNIHNTLSPVERAESEIHRKPSPDQGIMMPNSSSDTSLSSQTGELERSGANLPTDKTEWTTVGLSVKKNNSEERKGLMKQISTQSIKSDEGFYSDMDGESSTKSDQDVYLTQTENKAYLNRDTKLAVVEEVIELYLINV